MLRFRRNQFYRSWSFLLLDACDEAKKLAPTIYENSRNYRANGETLDDDSAMYKYSNRHTAPLILKSGFWVYLQIGFRAGYDAEVRSARDTWIFRIHIYMCRTRNLVPPDRPSEKSGAVRGNRGATSQKWYPPWRRGGFLGSAFSSWIQASYRHRCIVVLSLFRSLRPTGKLKKNIYMGASQRCPFGWPAVECNMEISLRTEMPFRRLHRRDFTDSSFHCIFAYFISSLKTFASTKTPSLYQSIESTLTISERFSSSKRKKNVPEYIQNHIWSRHDGLNFRTAVSTNEMHFVRR